MHVLDIYAGPSALARIREEGFHPELFDYFLGASGGPKWFVLAGLDRVIFPEFFKQRKTPIDVVGSSAGAFRAACFAQSDPRAAINRLAERYSQTTYSDKPTAREITEKGRDLLDYLLGDKGVDEIIANPLVRAHFIVARCKGLGKSERKSIQLAGLIASATANLVSRKSLARLYERAIFASPHSSLELHDPYDLPSFRVDLSRDNLTDALMASGSIPVVLEGVENIAGAPSGMYRDGGIVDYHFDVKLGPRSGLTLYPHFYAFPSPGWFDKSLKSRNPHHSSYDNVVMVVPSQQFVTSLPYNKIPDRKDFETMDAKTRIAYWQKVLIETDRLGEAFMDLWQSELLANHVKPLPFLTE
ncbi:patatin-like phospholipase family protein [Aestuariibacter salexigens]|uniref:patatin-like phospholipase family protein n=1 Tax=Aestuariibacter salexigens TaxID=226010 RepID=UPI000428D833|nr:patatin-like phospholipase family protein [Aestuariibacter salexigens]